jgi:hypothetical protein
MADLTMGLEGVYPHPLSRTTNFQIPMVSGYTTGRLFAQVVGLSGYGLQDTRVVVENPSATSYTLQMMETDDRVSGPRFNIGPAISLVPRGQKTLVISPIRDFLEFKTTTGAGLLRAQLTSQLQWRQMAFDKTETIYPSVLQKKFPDNNPFPNV